LSEGAPQFLEPVSYSTPVESEEPASIDFFQHSVDELITQIGAVCGKKYHGESFARYVFKHKFANVDQMLSLSQENRERLKNRVDFKALPVKKRLVSRDGTVKFLFEVETPKGPQEIEAVYIPEETRVTLCVSSQVGCKMACAFCLTAQLGFKSHLRASQIVRQFWTVSLDPELRPITNIVFMGMGEPLDNMEEVRRACHLLTDPRAFDLSARKITVSTVGLVEKINLIKKEDPFRLAVSLNGSDNEVRDQIMPINKRWNVEQLIEACAAYAKRTNKRVTFEYILMAGLTDRAEDVKKLIRLLSKLPCKINLIPYNESPFTSFKRPSEDRIKEFHAALLAANFPVFIRKNRGNDIFAACGMLKKIHPEA
jgi:23S rRNA (adenine2503-C2)-methyltransferase